MAAKIGPDGVVSLNGLGVDHFYAPDDWECTYNADQLDLLEEQILDGPGYGQTEPVRVATLIEGPMLFAMMIPVSWDDGEAEDYELRLFASADEAKAARAAAAPGATQ